MRSKTRPRLASWLSALLNLWLVISIISHTLLPAVSQAAPPRQEAEPTSTTETEADPAPTPQATAATGDLDESKVYLPLAPKMIPETNNHIISPKAGGRITSTDGQVTITFRPDGLPEPIMVAFKEMVTAALPGNFALRGPQVTIQAHWLDDLAPIDQLDPAARPILLPGAAKPKPPQPQYWATVSMRLAAGQPDPNRLAIARLVQGSQKWEILPTQVNPEAGLALADPLGYVTRYGYDPDSRLETVTDPLKGVTTYTYDANDNLTKVIDPLLNTTQMTYDATNRLTTLTDAEENPTHYCYDAEDQLIRVENARGAVTEYDYDPVGRLRQVRDPLGAMTTYDYDLAGNLEAVIDPAGRRTDYSYDDLNRLTTIAQPELPGGVRPTTHFDYDPVGNLIAITSPRGFVTRFEYDANDNVATITDPLGGQVSYTYDVEDNPLTITDANDHTTTTNFWC